MIEYRKKIHWLLIALLCLAIWINPLQVYAFSFEQVTSEISGNGIIKALLGVLFSKIFYTNTSVNSAAVAPDQGKQIEKTNKEIIGFYAEWWSKDTSSFQSLSSNVKAIRTIAPFWASLEKDGTLTDRGGEDHVSVVEYAHNNQITVLLLLNNVKESNGHNPIHTVLSDQRLRAKAITSINAYIKKYKLDGINIDFEMVPPSDRDNLTLFMKELSAQLKPQGYLVTIDVFPKQDESNDVAYAYDYEALARYTDKIMLMTYDQHGAWSGPGPIADSKWIEKNLLYALQYIPKTKLYLGIAAYGYDWSAQGVESINYQQAIERADKYNAPIQSDKQSQTPYFYYTDKSGIEHQVWFENGESVKPKLDLVNRYDLAGIAMWKLGEEDPIYWKIFREKLK